MNLSFWTCKCKRSHMQGQPKCRACGDTQASYGTNGTHIGRKAEPATKAKPKVPKQAKRTGKPPPPHAIGETENFLQSTLVKRD